jgi:hypothetical protein
MNDASSGVLVLLASSDPRQWPLIWVDCAALDDLPHVSSD